VGPPSIARLIPDPAHEQAGPPACPEYTCLEDHDTFVCRSTVRVVMKSTSHRTVPREVLRDRRTDEILSQWNGEAARSASGAETCQRCLLYEQPSVAELGTEYRMRLGLPPVRSTVGVTVEGRVRCSASAGTSGLTSSTRAVRTRWWRRHIDNSRIDFFGCPGARSVVSFVMGIAIPVMSRGLSGRLDRLFRFRSWSWQGLG
jgi:hypothetical protein